MSTVINSLFVNFSKVHVQVSYFCFVLLCVAMPLGGGCDLLATGEAEVEEKQQDTPVFEKHDNLLHGDTNKRWGYSSVHDVHVHVYVPLRSSLLLYLGGRRHTVVCSFVWVCVCVCHSIFYQYSVSLANN